MEIHRLHQALYILYKRVFRHSLTVKTTKTMVLLIVTTMELPQEYYPLLRVFISVILLNKRNILL